MARRHDNTKVGPMNANTQLGFDPAAVVRHFVARGQIRFEPSRPLRRRRRRSPRAEDLRTKRQRLYAQGLTAKGTPRKGRPARAVELKAWLSDEAKRCGVTPHAIYMRLKRGKIQRPKL